MKLLEKITNLFMDEVEEDEELEEVEKEEYKEPPKKVLPKIMRDTIAKEEKKEELPELDIKPIPKKVEPITREEKKELKSNPVVTEQPKKFNFPIDFDEEVKKAEVREQIPQRRVNTNIDALTRKNVVNRNVNVLNDVQEQQKKINELYPKKESNIKPKFKASPVISPVYGILDKNYTKEEVREKTDDNNAMKRPSKKVDFETVRKKAFGNLADEIKDNLLCENCELYKEVKKISSLHEDDLLYDMTVESEKEVTIEKAYDNYEEFGVAYEPRIEKLKQKEQVEKDVISDNIDTKKEDLLDELTKEDIIINNNVNTNNDAEINFGQIKDKIEDEEIKTEELPEEKEVKEEKIPSRKTSKKEEKVDDDFFELIDSMYKERIDE